MTYAVEPAWRAVLRDLDLDATQVLRRAGLPEDLFLRGPIRLDSPSYFALWSALEAEVDDPLFPLKLQEVLRSETFSPPIFAALCSPNFATAIRRCAHYKPLVAPIRLLVSENDDVVRLEIRWLDHAFERPDSMVTAELAFFVHLIRMATRQDIRPHAVVSDRPLAPHADCVTYFGVAPEVSNHVALTFSRADAYAPFLTSNEPMWAAFEPELRRRLADLEATATVSQRVQAVLHEALPSGQANMEAVARRLAMSKRTLQRRLTEEGTTFQRVLQQTREAVARHYLTNTSLAAAEISFLLGFEEPNSFYRAFRDWTGQTPETVRRTAALH